MTAPNDFLIATYATGTDPENWTTVSSLLSSVSSDITAARALTWEIQPFSKYVTIGDGSTNGLGFPVVKWTFKDLRVEQRENLRDFISGTSAQLYIRTATNETSAGVRTWQDYLCIGHWMQRSEVIADGLDYAEMIELRFTHCELVGG